MRADAETAGTPGRPASEAPRQQASPQPEAQPQREAQAQRKAQAQRDEPRRDGHPQQDEPRQQAPRRRLARGALTGRVPELLRETEFRRYWSGQTISMFGDQISGIAIPLAAVLVLHASAAEMGYLTALVWLPSLLFGLHAGAWVDRRAGAGPP